MLTTIKNRLNKLRQRKKVIFDSRSEIDRKTIFEGNNRIGKNAQVRRCYIGYGSYISEESVVTDAKIGRFTCIAPYVKTVRGQHPVSRIVSIHPAFYSARKQAGFSYVNETIFEEFKNADENTSKAVIIGNDCWIGYGVTILEGVKIGNGVVVAAGAVVNHDLEDYGIYGGVPAKLIRKRFSDEQISFLSKFKWWEKDEEWIKQNAALFQDINRFVDVLNIRGGGYCRIDFINNSSFCSSMLYAA